MLKNIALYGLLSGGLNAAIKEKKKYMPGVYGFLSFTASEIIYDNFKDKKMLPFDWDKYQEYIFAVLFQTMVNSVIYDDNYKLILIDNLIILSSIYISQKLISE